MNYDIVEGLNDEEVYALYYDIITKDGINDGILETRCVCITRASNSRCRLTNDYIASFGWCFIYSQEVCNDSKKAACQSRCGSGCFGECDSYIPYNYYQHYCK